MLFRSIFATSRNRGTGTVQVPRDGQGQQQTGYSPKLNLKLAETERKKLKSNISNLEQLWHHEQPRLV